MSIGIELRPRRDDEDAGVTPGEMAALALAIMETSLVLKPSEEEIGSLKRLLAAQPLNVQKMWRDVLIARIAGTRAEGRSCGCRPDVKLTVCQSGEGGVDCVRCGRRFASASAAAGDESVTAERSISHASVQLGTYLPEAVERRFGVEFRASQKVVIVDRFAIVDAVRYEARGPGTSGLRKILTLARDSGVPTLRIICGSEGRYPTAGSGTSTLKPLQIIDRAREMLESWSLGQLRVDVSIVRRSDDMHDRWIGASWSKFGFTSWHLGKGLTQFDGEVAKALNGFSRMADSNAWDVARRAERGLICRETLAFD